MQYFDHTSLYKTLDNVLHAELFEQKIPKDEKEEIGQWISQRQGIRGSYSCLFAPTEKDYKDGSRLFTGEPINSGAATAHILGEEAMITLQKWQLTSPEIQKTLHTAKKGWNKRFKEEEELNKTTVGMFCCGKCTNSYWRALHFGCIDNADERITAGLKILHQLHDDKGKWRRFPFYHTIWVLSDLNYPQAKEELQYVSPIMKRYLNRKADLGDLYQNRRRLIIQKAIIHMEK